MGENKGVGGEKKKKKVLVGVCSFLEVLGKNLLPGIFHLPEGTFIP